MSAKPVEGLGRCNASPDMLVFLAGAHATLDWMAATASIMAFFPCSLSHFAPPPCPSTGGTWSSGGAARLVMLAPESCLGCPAVLSCGWLPVVPAVAGSTGREETLVPSARSCPRGALSRLAPLVIGP